MAWTKWEIEMHNVDKAVEILKANIELIKKEAADIRARPARNERMAEKLEKKAAKIEANIEKLENGELPVVNNSNENLAQSIINAETLHAQGRADGLPTWAQFAQDLFNPIDTRDIRGL